MNTQDSSLHRIPGDQPPTSLGTLPAFTRLATKRHSLPKEKKVTHPVEFLHQLNSVSRTTYILTISHGRTQHLPRLLTQKKKTITLSFTDRHKVKNQLTNSHDTPAFIKPIRRNLPPHHNSHQPNPPQHIEQTHHPTSEETCTLHNSIPVPTPLPTPPPDPKV